MTDAEATWSRQLHCILSRTLTGEAQRRLQSVTEGEGAEAWRIAADFYEPSTVGRYLGMMEDVVTYGLGRLNGAWGRAEQLKAEQSGEAVPESVRQAAFHTGAQDHGDQGPRGAPLGAIRHFRQGGRGDRGRGASAPSRQPVGGVGRVGTKGGSGKGKVKGGSKRPSGKANGKFGKESQREGGSKRARAPRARGACAATRSVM